MSGSARFSLSGWTCPQPPQARSGTSRQAGVQGSVYRGLDPPPAAASKVRCIPVPWSLQTDALGPMC
ncbi:hypothetical protein NDU88_001528 [Pleurodeles waltl]|uniref:Uncharacterized protein n=1 Tax=Pleurodeles waltl TaxID=8319 RepID=A0AAV7MT08_PLEWA|nr:hypothetical protein NDU88_001528 [Pleurodeles waltl]